MKRHPPERDQEFESPSLRQRVRLFREFRDCRLNGGRDSNPWSVSRKIRRSNVSRGTKGSNRSCSTGVRLCKSISWLQAERATFGKARALELGYDRRPLA